LYNRFSFTGTYIAVIEVLAIIVEHLNSVLHFCWLYSVGDVAMSKCGLCMCSGYEERCVESESWWHWAHCYREHCQDLLVLIHRYMC